MKEEWKTKTEEQNMGPPELIYIEHDDYHAKYVGHTASGLQFFFPPIFVPGGGEFSVLFLFNMSGDLGAFVVKPSDEDYDKAKQEYGLDVPGDTRHILRRWINNECVVERNEKATL